MEYLKRYLSVSQCTTYMHNYNFTYQILGVTCDNASNNDTMVEKLAEIMSHFAGEANRARCLAHIVNLVAKIILRQFDYSKKKNKKKNLPQGTNDADVANVTENNVENEVEDLADEYDDTEERVLDKEEKEMDEGNDDEGKDEDNDVVDAKRLARDIEIIEEVMNEEIEGAASEVKPVRQALYKVGIKAFMSFCLLFFYPFF